MKPAILLAAAALMLPGMAAAQITHFPAGAGPNGAPPFSGSVMVGNTLYVSGTTDGGFKEGDTNAAAAKRVLDYFKGPLPARAFLGTNALLNGARFEVMGIAAKP